MESLEDAGLSQYIFKALQATRMLASEFQSAEKPRGSWAECNPLNIELQIIRILQCSPCMKVGVERRRETDYPSLD